MEVISEPGDGSAMALDDSGKAHISYISDYGLSRNTLQYATNASGAWVTETASNRWAGNAPVPSSIAVSPDGVVHITHNGNDGSLLHTVSCEDLDGDGYASDACEGSDCDDSNPEVKPGTAEICDDGLDNDCNGLVDASDPACEPAPCLIRAATLGSGLETRIEVLRTFRDRYLMTGPAGRAFVNAYDAYGRPAAHLLEGRPRLRALVRTLLLPVIGLVSLLV